MHSSSAQSGGGGWPLERLLVRLIERLVGGRLIPREGFCVVRMVRGQVLLEHRARVVYVIAESFISWGDLSSTLRCLKSMGSRVHTRYIHFLYTTLRYIPEAFRPYGIPSRLIQNTSASPHSMERAARIKRRRARSDNRAFGARRRLPIDGASRIDSLWRRDRATSSDRAALSAHPPL